jgi:hypothetical protein
MTNWRNRIVGQGEVDPESLLANPLNWRIHPKDQQDALEDVIDQVGWVSRIIVNQRTGFVIDGHLRISLALRNDEALVPVTYVDLDEQEEYLVLATLDPIAGMAIADNAQIAQLMGSVETDSEAIQALLRSIESGEDIPIASDIPQSEMCECPLCGNRHRKET